MHIQLKEALEKILTIDARSGNNGYAIAYARTALAFPEMSNQSMKMQVRYVISNLQYWRGEEARETKKILNDFLNGRIN
jgi:hypothetical protein